MTTIKSIEEKARRYDNALERANKLKETCDSNAVVGWMEYIFPELKESGDIRKRIIDALHGDVLEMGEIKKAIAWLEKQGEQKSAMSKIKVGDYVVIDGEVLHVKEVTEDGYLTDEGGLIPFRNEKEARLWTIQDTKAGDVLADGNLPFIFKKIDANRYSYAYCGISVDDGFKIESGGESGEWTWMQDVKPSTKEQRDTLMKAMADAGYTFDFEKKELKKIKKKPVEWSEEDENRINRLIAYFEDKESFTAEDDVVYANWLKSLRPQSTWKPSDEKMEYLAKAITTLGDEGDCKTASILNDLRFELKKLREE